MCEQYQERRIPQGGWDEGKQVIPLIFKVQVVLERNPFPRNLQRQTVKMMQSFLDSQTKSGKKAAKNS